MNYKKFVVGFAEIAKPLTQLTEEKRIFQWSPEAQAAFWSLKEPWGWTMSCVKGHL
jgi:hypothetical protein